MVLEHDGHVQAIKDFLCCIFSGCVLLKDHVLPMCFAWFVHKTLRFLTKCSKCPHIFPDFPLDLTGVNPRYSLEAWPCCHTAFQSWQHCTANVSRAFTASSLPVSVHCVDFFCSCSSAWMWRARCWNVLLSYCVVMQDHVLRLVNWQKFFESLWCKQDFLSSRCLESWDQYSRTTSLPTILMLKFWMFFT